MITLSLACVFLFSRFYVLVSFLSALCSPMKDFVAVETRNWLKKHFLFDIKMTIPLTLLNRFAVPFLVATLYLGNVNFPEQVKMLDTTMEKSDAVFSKAKGEGQNSSEEFFDYVIVGAGSAGAIVANSLSASGEHRVLILEGGGDPNPVTDVPYGQRLVWQTGIMNWDFSSVKQNRSCLALDGICPFPRGKTLGGTSQINGLMYNRAMPQDYDYWAEFTGDNSWRWENVRESFNRIENYHGFYENSTSGHGTTGEMHIGRIEHLPGVEVVMEALTEKGFPIGDLNAGDLTAGFSKVDFNIWQGLRMGTYQAFLEPILNRTNLVVYRYALATKILFEDTAAVGVTYERHGLTQTAYARKEVILSAGAIGSAQLLLLSGIGPREHLEGIGIQTLVDLPVGEYLQEHPVVDVVDIKNGGFRLNTTFGVPYNTTEAVLQYLENGSGTMNGFLFGNGFVSQLMWGNVASSLNPDPKWPEIHVYVWETLRQQEDGDKELMYFSVELLRSGTRGNIRLASTNPHDKPLIDPNFFADPTDLDRMIDSINIMLDVFTNSTAFQRVGLQMIEPIEVCSGEEFLSREYWKCYIMQNAWPSFHPTSTCRMAPNGSQGVVDSTLRVFNTTSLRVIDASIMPGVASGNTNMPSMLIGQRGAEIILSGR